MYNSIKTLLNRLFLPSVLPLLVLAGGCRTAVDQGELAGVYRSTTFIVPGPADGPDDVGARGGFIELRLSSDGTVSGRQHMPQDPEPAADQVLDGTYTVSGDTIRFTIGEGTWLAAEPMLLAGDEIRSQRILRRGAFEIVLRKMR